MSLPKLEEIERIIKIAADKNVKWAQAKAYGSAVPVGWYLKKEPTELAAIAKQLLEENKQLKLKIEQLETK